MSEKPDLVLDIAGVIATNFSTVFWEEMSLTFGVKYDDLIQFRKEIREELWTGAITEQEFWMYLVNRFPTINKAYARCQLLSLITPLSALEEIPVWSKYASIHLLSNHRIEWVKHIIQPVENHIKSITISSEVGCCKPQVGIYLEVASILETKGEVLFVDDQEKNLREARNLGWNTLLADDKGEWIKKISDHLVID